MFRMSEGERIDRSSLLMRGGQAAPLKLSPEGAGPVSYTHLRAHETDS